MPTVVIIASTFPNVDPERAILSLADRSRRTVLFTGQGSHQLTANDVGTMGRNGLNPIIFVLNNAGYMVERALEEDPDWVYNDLAPWNYHALPAALGCQGWFTAIVTTLGELDAALARDAIVEPACCIEVVAARLMEIVHPSALN